MKKFVLIVIGMLFSSSPIWAQDGWYIGMDLGVAMAPSMDVITSDDDVSTPCDPFINPNVASDCDRSPSSWDNKLDGGTGILAGVALGYRLGSFRIEGEYFYRGTTHDDIDETDDFRDPVNQDKAQQELDLYITGVDDVLSHNFFGNLYYDYHSDSKFTPYMGAGVGFAQVSLDYFSTIRRNHDPSQITTFPQNAELNKQLAGTTTIGRAKLSDTLFEYQLIAGVDYWVSEPVSLGLKFRWADFGKFEDEREWNQLRSHDSAIRPGGERIQYKVMTNDIQFWGVSLNMKYQF